MNSGPYIPKVALCLLAPLLSGCSLARFSDISTATSVLPAVQGNVHGGQQPVANSTIQLYAANITANKGASLPILLSTVMTDSGGNFHLTGTYACPTPSSLIYITATGGNPGLGAGTNNTGLALMAALGTCGSFLTGGSSITVIINELTTVAAIEALAPFMADITHVGANSASNPNALAGAFAGAAAIVSSSTGQFVAPRVGGPVPQYALYNTLANIIASCVNTAGNTGSTTNCYKLFNATAVATDTIAALLYIQQHPANNVATLYPLAGATGAPFQPTVSPQPADFTAPLTVTVPNAAGSYTNNAYYLAIDGNQNVWVASVSTATNGIHVYDNNENLIATISVPGFQGVLAMATDPFGNVWVLNNGFSGVVLLEYAPGGALLSPAAGYPARVGAVAPDFYQMAFDSTGNVWTSSVESQTSRPCLQKFSPAGVSLFAPVCFNTSTSTPRGITLDSTGNAYLVALNPTVMFKVDPLGNVVTTAPFSATGLPLVAGSGLLHFDPNTNHIVVYEPNAFSARNTDGTQAFASVSSTTALQAPTFFTLDGGGNIWYGNSAISGYYSVAEISAAGTFITPTNGFPTSGYIPAGINNPKGIGVDSYGNVWVVSYPIGNNAVTGFLQKIPGVAVPKTQQYY